jgi:uncharacterized membrane protein YhhN
MGIDSLALVFAFVAAGLYGWLYCNAAPSLPRVTFKTAATAGLTVYAYLSGDPILLVAALGFSTLGDALLGASEDKFLLPGMGAFALAHLAYVALFYPAIALPANPLILLIIGILTLGSILLIRWLWTSIEPSMRVPVAGYMLIILSMVALALELPPAYWLVMIGALAFAASDAILSIELFKLKPGAPARVYTSRLVWGLYFGGQAMITIGWS